MRKLLTLILTTLVIAGHATTYNVSDLSTIAGLNLVAGDVVVIQNGTYTDPQFNVIGTGAQGNPVIYTAQTPGSVIFTGNVRITMMGSYVKFQNIYFKSMTQASDDSPILFHSSQKYDTVYNCVFDNRALAQQTSKEYKVITLGGVHAWCKRLSFTGIYIHQAHIAMNDLSDKDVDSAGVFSVIDSCFFGQRLRINNNGNGMVRFGLSGSMRFNAYDTLMNSYFEECNANSELITNKSSQNAFIHNTFYHCKGNLSIRHGDSILITLNYWDGGGIDSTAGIRMTDYGHTIINNQFYNIGGTQNDRVAITITEGTLRTGCDAATKNDGGRPWVKNVLIANNSFINNTWNINMGSNVAVDPFINALNPQSLNFKNNLFYNSTNPLERTYNTPIAMTASNNYYFGTTTSYTVGFTNPGNLNLTADGNGVYHISSTSPAAVQALDTDNGLIYSQTSSFVPIKKSEVGATWWDNTTNTIK